MNPTLWVYLGGESRQAIWKLALHIISRHSQLQTYSLLIIGIYFPGWWHFNFMTYAYETRDLIAFYRIA
jgi:hypothetical protein